MHSLKSKTYCPCLNGNFKWDCVYQVFMAKIYLFNSVLTCYIIIFLCTVMYKLYMVGNPVQGGLFYVDTLFLGIFLATFWGTERVCCWFRVGFYVGASLLLLVFRCTLFFRPFTMCYHAARVSTVQYIRRIVYLIRWGFASIIYSKVW